MKFLRRLLRHGRISRPCQSAGTQRRDICHFIAAGEPFKISLQHGTVSHHMMGEKHGLRSLHMGIAGQDDILVFFRYTYQRFFGDNQLLRQLRDMPAHIHMEICSALVIPASCRVEPCSRITDIIGQTLFHIHMDIFQFHRKCKPAFVYFFFYFQKAPGNLFQILFGNDAMVRQHGRMSQRSGNIFFIHTAVVGNRSVEIKRASFLRLLKTAAPYHFTHFSFFSFISARMVRGSPKRLMKPSASAWLYTSSSPNVTNSSL